MPRRSTSGQALAALATQHADLRDRIARCEQLADELDAGRVEPAALLREVADLRVAFDRHNRFEQRWLPPLLAAQPGAVRVSRMVDDHIDEHRAIRRALVPGAAAELRGVLADLRDHLDNEERTLESSRVVRGDLAR
jgi:hypothetical protein